MPKLTTLLLLFALIVAPSSVPAQRAPAKWSTLQTPEGVSIHTPPDLKPGEVFSVAIYPEQPLDGKPIEQWLQLAIPTEPSLPGALITHGVEAKSANVAVGVAGFNAPDGAPLFALYTAFSPDRETVTIMRVVTHAKTPLFDRYQAATEQISGAMIDSAKRSAVAAGRGTSIEKLPATPAGMKPGGEVVEGIYTGNLLYKDEVLTRYRLYLYANGEYRMTNADGKELGDGQYSYDARTGKIDIGRTFDLNNDRTDPDEEFCLYGRDAEGKPYIRAADDWGLGWRTATLRYAGAVDRPAPEAEKQAEAAAEAEARRYKFTVAPGAGLKQNEIAGIMLNSTGQSVGTGYTITYDVYLLLTDGTIYNDLPVAPDEIDVSMSRRKEPEKWGRWRKQGDHLVAAWRDKPNDFQPLLGAMGKPGGRGERVRGRFGSASSSGGFGFGSFSFWGVTFAPEGRFQKDSRGGASSGNTGMEGQVSVNTVYDESGTHTTASGNGVGVYVGSERKKGGDRAGTYSIDGYVLTLKYDDGRTVRQPFFYSGDERKSIWFEGALLTLDEDEK